jgi:hypothetical protein
MARSVGITASAVVVLIGSALTILFGAVAVLASFALNLRPMPSGVPHLGYVMLFEAAFAFGLGGWGIATGVGVIRTKEWARISIIVFAALLTLFSLLPALIFAFIPLPIPNDPNLPSNFATFMRVGIVSFYGLLALLGGFWLYFFNIRRVRAQFQGKQATVEAAPAYLPAEMPSANLGAPTLGRPLSITIIAWFLLIGSAFAPLGLLYSHAMFPTLQLPLCFLGFFVFGRVAVLISLVWVTVQVIAAIGLLRLRNWARITTIGLQCLGFVNTVLVVGISGNRTRFQQIMDSMIASMNLRTAQPISFTFPVWLGWIVSLPIFFVILWFLITQKPAFVKRDLA